MSSLCPLPLGHLFHSAADLHFPQSSIWCLLYQKKPFLLPFVSYQIQLWAGFPNIVPAYSGSICIFLGYFPLLPLLYTSLLCLGLVRGSFLIFTYLFCFYSCLLGWMALELGKIILENQLAFLKPYSFWACGILPNRFLDKSRSALFSTRVVVWLFGFCISHRHLTMSWSLPQLSHSQYILPCF